MNATFDPQDPIQDLLRELERIKEFLRTLPVDLNQKDLIAIAEEEGWEVVRGGYHTRNAKRPGYPTVSLCGHGSAPLNPLTARNIVTHLLQPKQDRLMRTLGELVWQARGTAVDGVSSEENVIFLWQELAIAKARVEKLKADCEAAFSLADEQEQRNHQLQRENNQLLDELVAAEAKLRQLELVKEQLIRNAEIQLAIVREQQETALAAVEALEKKLAATEAQLAAERELNRRLLAVLAKLAHFCQSLPIGFREVALKLLQPVRLHLQTLSRP